MTTAGIKRILQEKTDQMTTVPFQAIVPVASSFPETSPEFPGAMTNEVTAATLCDFPSHDLDVSPCEKPTDKPSPRLTKSMNPKFFEKSAMCTAWQAQKEQKFGKDNLHQVFTTERVFPHVVFFLLKYEFLDADDRTNLFEAMPSTRSLWTEYHRVKDIDWTPLCQPNPNWNNQTVIDDNRVDMCTAMLFHYNMDLAAVHQKIGGNHVGAHRPAEVILEQVMGILSWEDFEHLRRILYDSCPHIFNQEATYEQYLEMHKYGNHQSIDANLEKVMLTMNKEDCKDHVLTFPAFLAEFLPDLIQFVERVSTHSRVTNRHFYGKTVPASTAANATSGLDGHGNSLPVRSLCLSSRAVHLHQWP